jgi:uncharacterized protein YjdB
VGELPALEFLAQASPGATDTVSVVPSALTLEKGGMSELYAVVADRFGNEIPEGELAWSSSDATVASVDGDGKVTALAAGSTDILASSQGVVGRASVTVTDSTLSLPSSLVITPDSLSFSALEETGALTATSYNSLGEKVSDVIVNWVSSDPSIASVTQEGVVTSKAWGQTLVIATLACCSATDTTVVAVEQSVIDTDPYIEMTVPSTTFEEAVWVGYAAEVINAHLLGVEDPQVTVTSSDPGTLLVAGDSLLGIQPGTVWLVGTYDALRDSVAVTVQPTQIQTLKVAPASASMEVGTSLDLQVTALDGSQQEVTGRVLTWASSNPGAVTVEDGHVTAVATGTADVSVSVGQTTGSASITAYEDAPYIQVSPDSTTFEEAVWVGYAAEVINAHLLGVEDPPVTVTSSDPSTLQVAGDSLLGLRPGTVWLVGTYEALRDSVAITVQPTQIQTLQVVPSSVSMEAGTSLDLQVTALNGSQQEVTGRVLTWGSSNPGVASVANGHVTAVSDGTAIVSAEVGESAGSATISVEGPQVPVDPTLTTDPIALQRALEYEQQFWDHRELFRQQVMVQINPPWYSDDQARDLGYSSGMGLAAYHTNDELTALARMIEVARDPERRAAYAAMGVEFLEILVPAIVTGEGTEGCSQSSSRYYCSPGYFRYLDAAHGSGAAGFIMNAIFEDPDLRPAYLEDLILWSNDLVPTLERHFATTEAYGTVSEYPHMPAKMAPAYLAIGKILSTERYLDGFERIVRLLGNSAEANGGWIGSDVSHATHSTTAISLGYREQFRGTIPGIVTTGHLQGIGEGFVELAASNAQGYSGTIVGPYGLLVRFSASVAARAGNEYSFSESVGSHALARVFSTVAGLAGGYATRSASDPP